MPRWRASFSESRNCSDGPAYPSEYSLMRTPSLRIPPRSKSAIRIQSGGNFSIISEQGGSQYIVHDQFQKINLTLAIKKPIPLEPRYRRVHKRIRTGTVMFPLYSRTALPIDGKTVTERFNGETQCRNDLMFGILSLHENTLFFNSDRMSQ